MLFCTTNAAARRSDGALTGAKVALRRQSAIPASPRDSNRHPYRPLLLHKALLSAKNMKHGHLGQPQFAVKHLAKHRICRPQAQYSMLGLMPCMLYSRLFPKWDHICAAAHPNQAASAVNYRLKPQPREAVRDAAFDSDMIAANHRVKKNNHRYLESETIP